MTSNIKANQLALQKDLNANLQNYSLTSFSKLEAIKNCLKKADKIHVPLSLNRNVVDDVAYYPFLESVSSKESEIMVLLIDYADNHNLMINVNEKNDELETPIIITFKNCSIRKFEMLIDYSNKHDIILNVNDKNKKGFNAISSIFVKRTDNPDAPFLNVYNMKIISMLFDYADDHNLIINVNEINKNGDSPLSLAIINNNIDIIEMLIKYANEHNIIFNLNEKNNDGNSPLSLAVINENIDIIEILIKYANQNNIILNINEKNENLNSPLSLAIKGKTVEIVQMLMEYADAHHVLLNITDNDLENIREMKIDILKLIANYMNSHNIYLEINDDRLYYEKMKDIINENETDKLKLLFHEVDENNIIININERYTDFNSLLSLAIKKDNIEMIKIFIEYAEIHNIGLKFTNDDKKHNSKINSEIIGLIEQYNNNRTGKPSSYKKSRNNSKSKSKSESKSKLYQSSNQLPGSSNQSQTPSLSQSQSELLTSLLSQPPDVIISILTQLQNSLQLLQSQPQSFNNLSSTQASTSLQPTAPPMYSNDSSDNEEDLPSYNEVTNSSGKNVI